MNINFLILLMSFIPKSSPIGVQISMNPSRFVRSLQDDLKQNRFQWISNKKQIPQLVFDFVVDWKRENTEEDKMEFRIANPNEDYNCCCTTDPKLPSRKLIWAGSKGKEWILIYQHGQGSVSNTKLLHVHTGKKNAISFFYLPFVPSFSEKKEKEVGPILWKLLKLEELCLFQGNSESCTSSATF